MFEIHYFNEYTLREFHERVEKINEEAWKFAEPIENMSDDAGKDKKHSSFHFPHRHHRQVHHTVH